jgi:hypothetical protein
MSSVGIVDPNSDFFSPVTVESLYFSLMSTLAAKLLPGKRIRANPLRRNWSEAPTTIYLDATQANFNLRKLYTFPPSFRSAFAIPFLHFGGCTPASMDVRSPAPYNEKNQLFGEKTSECRWT